MERVRGTGDGVGGAETERFARLLRELKERAGLSYGTLARRLHTSTSTLHRYCNGEAVPSEYAVPDRFARLCGASREEAVELHRAWLLADASRRTASPTAAAPPAPEAAPGSGVVAGAAPAVAPEVAPAPGPGPGTGWRRRWGGVVGGGVVAGVVVAVVSAAVLASGGAEVPGGRTVPPRGAGSAPAGPPVGTDAPVPGPAAPSATGPSAPAPGETAPGETAPAEPTGGATAPAGTPKSVPAAPPTAVVRSHVWASGCDHAYLSERAPADVPAPPVEADAPAWARAQRAVHAGSQIVEVTLHGTGEGAVVLQGMEVRVSARRTPPPWNVYRMSPGCGGALTPAVFAVNLDAPRPLARPVGGNDAGEPIPAPSFPLRVSAADPAVLRVEAAATGCDCEWYLDLRWSGPGGSSGTLRLDDSGRPWRTSATPGRPVYGFASEQGRWTR
ncbi:helix-turn-helix domain-containing protein [Streptomyces lavendulae]|uniref:helix-turn-helix domain-containing protein n=1 Tax=Streptomyces lavendulae TaxID=1914 RepID=UPI0036B0CD72